MNQEKQIVFQHDENRVFTGINRVGQPRLRMIGYCLMLAIAFIVTTNTVHAQNYDSEAAAIIGGGMGEALNSAIAGAQQMQHSAADASREIDATRRSYWDAVRTGQNVEEVRQEFARQLWAKDFLYMWLAIPGGIEAPQYQLFQQMSPIDGGIRPWARYEFVQWVNAIRQQLNVHDDTFIFIGLDVDDAQRPSFAQNMTFRSLEQLAEALENTTPLYETYIRARDWAEIDASGLTWPWDTDAYSHAVMILQRYQDITAEEAENELTEIIELLGEQTVLSAADRLRTAPRDASSNLANPQALGLQDSQPNVALTRLIRSGNGDGSTTVKWHLWREDMSHRNKSAKQALMEFERFVWAYGEENIETVGRFIMTVGYVFPPWRLRYDYPDMHVREVVAFSHKVTSKEQVDELHQQLLRQYDREQLIEASDVILPRRWRYSDALQQNNFERLIERHDGDTYAMILEVVEKGAAEILNAPPPMEENMMLIYNPNPTESIQHLPSEERHRISQTRIAGFAGAANGAIYGYTKGFGIFRMNNDGSNFRMLHQFEWESWQSSDALTLRLGPDNVLYGALESVSEESMSEFRVQGVFFRLNTDGSGFEILKAPREHQSGQPQLHNLRSPRLLTIGQSGNLLGMISSHQSGHQAEQVLFSLKQDGSELQPLYHFSAYPGSGWNALVDGGDGFVYGFHGIARPPGGTPPYNQVFRVRLDGSDYEVIHQIETEAPFMTNYQLILGSDGRLYGTCSFRNTGSAVTTGFLFRLERDGSDYTELHHFDRVQIDSAYKAPLVEAIEGNLYFIARKPIGDNHEERLIQFDMAGQVISEIDTPAFHTRDIMIYDGAVYGFEDDSHIHARSAVYPGSIYRYILPGMH